MAFAETPFATTVFGTVRIEPEAIRVSRTRTVPASTPKKMKCKKGKMLRHGKCVKKGKKKHPHKPKS